MKNLGLKLVLILAILALILISFFVVGPRITGAAIDQTKYSFTKAICDSDNLCQDFIIICKGQELVDITPTTFTIQQPEDWKDPRPLEEIEKLC
jgi:hypothetical protein